MAENHPDGCIQKFGMQAQSLLEVGAYGSYYEILPFYSVPSQKFGNFSHHKLLTHGKTSHEENSANNSSVVISVTVIECDWAEKVNKPTKGSGFCLRTCRAFTP